MVGEVSGTTVEAEEATMTSKTIKIIMKRRPLVAKDDGDKEREGKAFIVRVPDREERKGRGKKERKKERKKEMKERRREISEKEREVSLNAERETHEEAEDRDLLLWPYEMRTGLRGLHWPRVKLIHRRIAAFPRLLNQRANSRRSS
ncbi:unnamed protein product [Citrullus colocynthis]|uniref:Uncharacterized protein n=1 Tax=Citrullus colocynthis TaxID=252529 RepID=A0ABP0YAN7_9ROSI